MEISNFPPGTTIDIESGGVCYQREIVELVDFPGIYSLDGISDEETSVRRYLQEEHIDVIVPVLNASNLERNLYLLLQVAEYQLPGVVVVNMVDESEKAGIEIDSPGSRICLDAKSLPPRRQKAEMSVTSSPPVHFLTHGP